MKESIETIVNKYLQLSNYKVDSKSIKLQLLTHPDYPSIKSISDTYDYFGIENIVATIPFELTNQLPSNFICLINEKLQIVNIKKKFAYLTNEKLEKKKISIEKLAKTWEGTICAVEYNLSNNNKSNLFDFKKIFFYIFATIILISIFYNSIVTNIIYNLQSLIGLIISFFIVKESLGIHNQTIAKVCGAISTSSGCSNVINSNKNKLFGLISLSDAPILYFTVNLMTIILVEFNLSLFYMFSILCIPIILFTLYYQKFVLKEWCALCIGISIILTLQFITLFTTFINFTIDFRFLLKYTLIVITVICVWITIKTLWIKNAKLLLTEIDFFKFKRNYKLFNSILRKEKLANNKLIPIEKKISFGSKEPSIIIDAVTNPFCGLCTESFNIYNKLLKNNNDIQINFIFSVPNDITNPGMQIAVTILNIYFKESDENALIALEEWYLKREILKWQSTYGKPIKIDEEIFLILKNQQNWLHVNDITNTPWTFINDYYYPKAYNIEDLIYFIDDLKIS